MGALTSSVDSSGDDLTGEHDGGTNKEDGAATHLVDGEKTRESANDVDAGQDKLRLVRVLDARGGEELCGSERAQFGQFSGKNLRTAISRIQDRYEDADKFYILYTYLISV